MAVFFTGTKDVIVGDILIEYNFKDMSMQRLSPRYTLMIKSTRPVQKWVLLVLLVAGITLLHYSTDQGQYDFDLFYGELYFIPIALSAFWFGLRGALLTSGAITVCYLPYIFLHWQGSSHRKK